MRLRSLAAVAACLFLISGVACQQEPASYPDFQELVEQSLETAGLRDITADQDREMGVVTLRGEVGSEEERIHAEEIARASAPGQIIANEIAVRP